MCASSKFLVSSLIGLKTFLSSIHKGSTLYLDLEGQNLSRHGSIALATILVHPHETIRIIDVSALGNSAFSTSSGERTLKSILEDPNMPKYVWDVRNDADALWAHYRVGLAGVTDIQLLENASRPAHHDKFRLSSLGDAIQSDLNLGFVDRERWQRTKKDIVNLMPTGVFSKRPLDAKTIQYCINDVERLPDLQAVYMKRITRAWLKRAGRETERRLIEARSPGYKPQSPKKAFGPWRWKSAGRKKLDKMKP